MRNKRKDIQNPIIDSNVCCPLNTTAINWPNNQKSIDITAVHLPPSKYSSTKVAYSTNITQQITRHTHSSPT